MENCSCGYFKSDYECCGKGKVCPVCNLSKFVLSGEGVA